MVLGWKDKEPLLFQKLNLKCIRPPKNPRPMKVLKMARKTIHRDH